MHAHRSTSVTVLALVSVLMAAGVSSACVGARALSMGGAFTGLADDVSATYWNPAALVYLDGKHATWMHTANNRDYVNYHEYLAYTSPVGDRGAFGLSYISHQLMPSISMYDESFSWNQNWYWLSYGQEVGKTSSVGANVKFIDDDVTWVLGGVPQPVSGDTDVAVDLAYYRWYNDNVTLGLLIQNLNEPETVLELDGVPQDSTTWVRNWRPGIAVRFGDDLIVSAEVYDATDRIDRALRAGVEKRFPGNSWALRAGWYGNADAPTLGVGVWGSTWTLDAAWLGGDLDGTWLVSATAGF